MNRIGRVSFLISIASILANAQAPVITDVTDGGAFLPKIAQGGWVTIKGSNLASNTRVWADADFLGNLLPTALDQTSVTIDGRAAAVYYISSNQLNVLAPFSSATGNVTVTVSTPKGSASKTASLQQVAPSFFMLDPDDRRYVAAVNLDGTLVGRPGLYPSSPNLATPLVAGARALIYGTGWGLSDPGQPDGLVFTNARPLANAGNVHMVIGTTPVQVEFAGAVGPGLYQFNIVAPNLPSGDYAITGDLNGVKTQANAFITIQGAGPLPPQVIATPSSLSFQGSQGGAAPAAQTIQISSSGNPIDFTATADATWLTLDKNGGRTPTALKLSVNLAGLTAGSYSSKVTVLAPGSLSQSLSLTATLTVAKPGPSITSLTPAIGAPGQTISAFTVAGANLDGVSSIEFAGQTGITVSNIQATASSVKAQVTIPASATLGDVTVTVLSANGRSNSVPFSIRSATPVISKLVLDPNTVVGTVDFVDADGDVVYSAASTQSAPIGILRISVSPTPILPGCSAVIAFLDVRMSLLGITTGSIPINIQAGGIPRLVNIVTAATGLGAPTTAPVSVTLYDAKGHASNTLQMQVSKWFCGN